MLQSLFDRKRFLFNKLLDHTLAKLQLKVCKKRLFQIIKTWYGKFTLISNFTNINYLAMAKSRRYFSIICIPERRKTLSYSSLKNETQKSNNKKTFQV